MRTLTLETVWSVQLLLTCIGGFQIFEKINRRTKSCLRLLLINLNGQECTNIVFCYAIGFLFQQD